METDDAAVVAGITTANLEASEPWKKANGGRNESSGTAGVECHEKTISEVKEIKASGSGADVSGAAKHIVFESGDRKNAEGGVLGQCSTERLETMLVVKQVASGGTSDIIEAGMVTDTLMNDAEVEAGCSQAQPRVVGHKEVAGIQELQTGFETNSSTDRVPKEAVDVLSPVEEGVVASGEVQSSQFTPSAELSNRSVSNMNGSVNISPKGSLQSANVEEPEEPLLRSIVLSQKTETIRNRNDTMNRLENLMLIQESRIDVDRYRTSSSSITEAVAAEVAAGVAEGIAESIAESIAKETSTFEQDSTEGRLFDSGRFERIAIAKAVAQGIAEGVAEEVAQGLTVGLAEAAATAKAPNGVDQMKPASMQGTGEGNKDGVLCDCGIVAVVRIVGEKSPNRGLRYLMCSRQEPSFFKRKGKRKESDTIGKCKFFRWLDTPRHTSKEDKKNQEKEKAQLEELNVHYSTRSSAKKSYPESRSGARTVSSVDRGEIPPSDIPSSRNTDDNSLTPEVPESTSILKVKSTRKQLEKATVEKSGKDNVQVAERRTSAGTLTRSASTKGAPELPQGSSLDTSVVNTPTSTPASALGKRTSDWTDSYIGPEWQLFEKGGSWRKRRSVRGESGLSSRYSIGGSVRNIGFSSSEKKPLHYFRRSTGQLGVSDQKTFDPLSSAQPATDIESVGIDLKEEPDSRFKSYYKKNKSGSFSEQKLKRMYANTSDKLQLGGSKSRVNNAVEVASPVETEKKTKSQTRRQQRKLPLSEVYGIVEPLLPGKKTTKKGTTIPLDKESSLSTSKQSLGKSTPQSVATDHEEIGHSKSPTKKRKLSWVVSEDSVVLETDAPKRISVTNNSLGAITNSMVEAPLLASAFPTVRYKAKLPVEDFNDPDDPWSLEIPWRKEEDREVISQQQEREMCRDERSGETNEGEKHEIKVDGMKRTELVNEAIITREQSPKKISQLAEVGVSEAAELSRSKFSGGICKQISSENNLNAAAVKESDSPPSYKDQKTVNAVEATSTSLANAVQAEGIGLRTDNQELSDVLNENPADTRYEACIKADKTVEVTSIPATQNSLNSNTVIKGNSDSPVYSRDDVSDQVYSKSTHQNQEATPEIHGLTPPFGEGMCWPPRLCSDIIPPHSTCKDTTMPQNAVEVEQKVESSIKYTLDNGLLQSAPGVSEPSVQKAEISQSLQGLSVRGLGQAMNNLKSSSPSSQATKDDPKVLDCCTSPNEGGSDLFVETFYEQDAGVLQEQQTSVVIDDQNTGEKSHSSMLVARIGTQVEAGGEESLMRESAIIKVSTSVEKGDHTVPDKTDSTIPLEQFPLNEEIVIEDCMRINPVGVAMATDVMCEDNSLVGSVAVVSKDGSFESDHVWRCGTNISNERSEPPSALSDVAATSERDVVLSDDKHEINDFQENVKGIERVIEEPAISGSNLIAEGCLDGIVGQVSTHEPEKKLAHAPFDEDGVFRSPGLTDNAGAAAVSENAGFLNSVWRLASGKKTRSIGSIGAPTVTSKRSRSVLPSQKGGSSGESKGHTKHQAEIQWVDVPLDWRNEKSTGRVPLLSNSYGSELRPLQSADTSQGTHSARPRPARGEVDESSIITEEKGKDHDAHVTNGAAHARQANLGSTTMGDAASVPAGGYHLVGGPVNQQAAAGGENVSQKRKRGRPRKDSKKPVGYQFAVIDGHKVGAAGGVDRTSEFESASIVEKANGEPSSMLICSTSVEGNALTERHGEDRVLQLQRSASNTERENSKRERGGSSGPDECGRPVNGNGFSSAPVGGLQSEILVPYCFCKIAPRHAILETVLRSGDPNQSLRYWSCSNFRKLFPKKQKPLAEVAEESCNFFRWIDTPRFTAKDKREARKKRYRQVELQRLL